MTIEEALKKVKRKGMKIGSTAAEFPDCYVFHYVDPEHNDSLEMPSTAVYKKTGKTDVFFPPDHDRKYLDSGKEIDISDYL